MIIWVSNPDDHVRRAVPAAASSLIPSAPDQLARTTDLPDSPATALNRVADLREYLNTLLWCRIHANDVGDATG
ncbi:hypothetical protein [Saccharopolyspora shandongensis]|uniref:hypothetical protein n=1 Tax=Saccharopolyspora shandongensis TaxID=418495 RepID=UPI0033F87FC8